MPLKSVLRSYALLIVLSVFTFSTLSWGYYGDSSKSGYTTTTQVVDTKTLYVKHRFVEADFTAWLALLYKAQAYETFQGYLASGRLNRNGIVQGSPLKLGQDVFDIGVGVTVEDVADQAEPTFNASMILNALRTQTVLDANGYVDAPTQNAANASLYYDAYNFSFVLPKLKKLVLPVTNPVTREELLNELYSLILTKNRMVEVATQDTTRYQSRNDNIFSGLLESIGGNMLGSIFAPDRVRVNRQEYAYVPRTNIASLYPMRLAFSPYPYFDRRSGLSLLNGQDDNKELSFATAKLGDISVSRTEVSLKYVPKELAYGSFFSFFQFGADYGEVVKADGTRRQAVLSIGGGGVTAKSLSKYTLGLEYEKYQDASALGVILRMQMLWFVAQPVSLGLQGGLSASGIWQDYEVEPGLNFHFSSLMLGVGYRYYNYIVADKTNEASGVVGTVRYFF